MSTFVKKHGYSVLLFSSFGIIGVFLIWRAQFGYMYNDEPFCVTLAQRLYMGDSLIVDEWHGSQNFGILLLPLYALYQWAFHTTEGILLCFRYIYCILWFVVCIVLYRSLSTYRYFALAATVYMALFSPLDYMTLSYTSVSLMSVILLACICYQMIYLRRRNPVRTGVLLGLVLTITVLCCPFFAMAYVLYTLVVLALKVAELILKKKDERIRYAVKCWLGMTCSVAVLAIAYVLFLASKQSLSQIMANIPQIFKDPEHETKSFFGSIYSIFKLLFKQTKLLCSVLFAFSIVGVFLKNRKRYRLFLFLIAAAVWLYTERKLLLESFAFNYQMKDIALLGFLAFVLLEKKPWPILAIFYGLGTIYTYSNYIASNTGMIAISMTLSICGIAAILFIGLLGKELFEQYRDSKPASVVSVGLAAIVLFGQISLQSYIRVTRTYWDSPLVDLTEEITQGPAKGLYTSDKNKLEYDTIYENLFYLLKESYAAGGECTFLSATSAPWIYLAADMRYATFSAWTFGYGENLSQRLEQYFELNAKDPPDFIFFAEEVEPEKLERLDHYEIFFHGESALLRRTQ